MPMLLNDNLLELEGVSLSYGSRVILKGVDLQLRRGDFLAVTGANGGGKTSLIKIMLGLIAPTSGCVRYPGSCEGMPAGIGYLPQKNSMDMRFPITVMEMVESGFAGCRIKEAPVRKTRMEEVVELLELSSFLNRQIGEVSGGQFQRALMARALVTGPELLVLDEPTSYMDSYFEEKVFGILKGLSGKCTVVMVSHAVEKAKGIASRMVSVHGTVNEVAL